MQKYTLAKDCPAHSTGWGSWRGLSLLVTVRNYIVAMVQFTTAVTDDWTATPQTDIVQYLLYLLRTCRRVVVINVQSREGYALEHVGWWQLVKAFWLVGSAYSANLQSCFFNSTLFSFSWSINTLVIDGGQDSLSNGTKRVVGGGWLPAKVVMFWLANIMYWCIGGDN